MPAKPETLQRKGTLDRSVSLNSVSADNQTNSATSPRWIPILLERRPVEKEKKTELSRKNLTFMNRSTSLWSVQTPKIDYNQCKKSYGAPARLNSVSRPSKIPLPAARSTGLGRSLADLSQVDRVGEPVGQIISFELDLDAASDERIYENCRETLDRASKLSTSRISTSTNNLEERAARLMAQLEDDLEPKETVVSLDIVDVTPPCRAEIVYEDRETLHDSKTNVIIQKYNSRDDENKESTKIEEESKRRKTMIDIFKDNTKTEEDSKKRECAVEEYTSNQIKKNCEKPEEDAEKSRRIKETSIQELRRNWERQSKGNQDSDAKTIYVANSEKTVNLSKTIRTGNDVIDDAQGTKRKQCVNKRANDIEHLVNFFNCKNAEASKESPREVLIKPKLIMDVIETPALKKNETKGANEYSGYTSDGNCSEDSGHISNENEVEWKETLETQNQKETNDFKERQYFDRIDRDDVKLFDSTIVHRLAEPEKKNIVINKGGRLMTCNDNIDCCQIDDKCLENGRQVRLKWLCHAMLILNIDNVQ